MPGVRVSAAIAEVRSERRAKATKAPKASQSTDSNQTPKHLDAKDKPQQGASRTRDDAHNPRKKIVAREESMASGNTDNSQTFELSDAIRAGLRAHGTFSTTAAADNTPKTDSEKTSENKSCCTLM